MQGRMRPCTVRKARSAARGPAFEEAGPFSWSARRRLALGES